MDTADPTESLSFFDEEMENCAEGLCPVCDGAESKGTAKAALTPGYPGGTETGTFSQKYVPEGIWETRETVSLSQTERCR